MAVDDSFYSFYGIPGNKTFIFSFGVAQDFWGWLQPPHATPVEPPLFMHEHAIACPSVRLSVR